LQIEVADTTRELTRRVRRGIAILIWSMISGVVMKKGIAARILDHKGTTDFKASTRHRNHRALGENHTDPIPAQDNRNSSSHRVYLSLDAAQV
jgi:hypothetical protein